MRKIVSLRPFGGRRRSCVPVVGVGVHLHEGLLCQVVRCSPVRTGRFSEYYCCMHICSTHVEQNLQYVRSAVREPTRAVCETAPTPNREA